MRSPELRVELAPDARVLALMLAWPVACLAAIWAAPVPLLVCLAGTVAIPVLAWPVVSSQLFGLHSKAPLEVVCNARDQWSVNAGSGESEELELSGRSQVFPGVLVLLFRGTGVEAGRLRRWMVLADRHGQPASLRRLRVRVALELAKRRQAGWFQPAAGTPSGAGKAGRGCSGGAVATTIRPETT